MNNELIHRLEFDKILNAIALKASFSLGKERVLALEPSFSSLIVNRDLKRLEDAMHLLVRYGSMSFGGIQDVESSLVRASKGGTLPVDELVGVGRFMYGSDRLKKHYGGLETSYDSLDDLFESLVVDGRVLSRIEQCFGDNGEVLDRASETLRTLRKSIQMTRQSLEHKTQEFLTKNKAMLAESFVTLQNGRRTFLIKPTDKNKYEGTIYGQSASGQSVYFEPASIARIQNELSSLFHQEEEEIERICHEVSMEIGTISDQLLANLETCALLDEIFAKAEWGVSQDGTVARLSDDRLYLKNARHPLIDPKEVIKNTYTLEPPHRMVLISGPNTGGKSVTLKTMGLAVLMTLSGCPVLCEEAEVMMVDNIFVDIGDQQSIEKSLSSFSAHIETMTAVTAHATRQSLILLDELGSQTDPLEGESLSMAILDYFREMGCFVVATTHFSRLKKYGTQYDDILIASVEFDLNELKPTYRYREHVMGESNALEIATRLSLNPSIIEKARVYKKESTFEADHLLEILEARIKENDTLQETLKEKELSLVALEEAQTHQHQEAMERIQKEKEAWLSQQNALFNEKLDALEQRIHALNQQTKPTERHEILKEVKALKPKVVLEPLKVKDRVRILDTNQVGSIEKIEKETAFVLIGIMTLQVPLTNLEKVSEALKKPKKATRSHQVSKVGSFKSECNVIGKRVAEALPLVSKYLDDCLVNKMTTGHIVHGHGTGTLRNAVHDLLRKHKYVASFELAPLNEGGAGATKVVFKQ